MPENGNGPTDRSPTKPTTSSTTSPSEKAAAQNTPTSLERGKVGSDVQKVTASSRILQLAMTGSNPKGTNHALVESLPLPVASSLKLEFGTMLFPEKADPYRPFLGCSLTTPVSQADLDQARSILNSIMTPMSEEECVERLIAIKMCMRPQQLSGEEHEAQISIYARDMRAYPADVTRKVLEDWRSKEVFWPAVVDLLVRADKLVEARRAIARTLDEAVGEV